MIRRPPRSTLDRSSAASDVYKRQVVGGAAIARVALELTAALALVERASDGTELRVAPVSYTHLRAHETVLDLVCRLLLEKKTCTIATKHTSITSTTDKAS